MPSPSKTLRRRPSVEDPLVVRSSSVEDPLVVREVPRVLPTDHGDEHTVFRGSGTLSAATEVFDDDDGSLRGPLRETKDDFADSEPPKPNCCRPCTPLKLSVWGFVAVAFAVGAGVGIHYLVKALEWRAELLRPKGPWNPDEADVLTVGPPAPLDSAPKHGLKWNTVSSGLSAIYEKEVAVCFSGRVFCREGGGRVGVVGGRTFIKSQTRGFRVLVLEIQGSLSRTEVLQATGIPFFAI